MKKRILAILLTAVLTLGLLPAAAAEGTFSDVPTTYWGYDYIEAAAEAGLMKGTGGGLFSPELKVSVAQFLTLLGRLVFPDVKADGEDWYGPYVRAAQDAGLLDESQVDTDDAEAEITRYNMAAILRAAAKKLGVTEKKAWSNEVNDYFEIPNRYLDAVLAVYGMGLIKGDQAGSFNGNNTMTRAEVATVIVRLKEAKPKEDIEGARKAIIQRLNNMEEGMLDTTPYHISQADLSALVEEILESRSDNYFVFSAFWGPLKRGSEESTGVGFRYHGTKAEYDEYKQEMKEVREKAEEIVAATVTADMSDYEIAKVLHDYLVLNVEYDRNVWEGFLSGTAKSRPVEHGIYYPLMEYKATCSTYASAYKYLLNLACVPCEEINGDSDGTDPIAEALGYTVSHAWNIVQIDGEWYHVDVTWDDLGGDDIRYDYFLKSDKALRGHYNWDAPHACTSTKYDDMAADELRQQKHAEQEAEREAKYMILFMERFNSLPYRSAEGLTGTDELSDEELLSYSEDKVHFPKDQYSYEEMEQIYFAVAHNEDKQVFQLNGQFAENSYEDDQWYLVVFRYDVWEEYYRRNPQFRPQS